MGIVAAVTANMRAIVPDPDAPGRVRMDEVASPDASDGGIVVAVEALSINRGETFALERPPADWRPGKDVAGVVAAVGPGAAGFEVGERVVAHAEQGGWAERVAVAADRAARLPDAVLTINDTGVSR